MGYLVFLGHSKIVTCLLAILIEHFSSNHCEWDVSGILTALAVQKS